MHHSLGYPLSRKEEQRFQILGNLGFSTDIALREGPYKITPDEVFHIEDDPLEQNPLELVTPSAFQPLKEKLTQGFLIIDRMNSLKLWAPCKGEKLSLFAHQRESELLETLKKHPQPKDLEWMGNLANFFPPAFLLKKLSSLVSLKIKDSLLDPDVFLALIKNNRLKKLVLENVYGIDSCFQQLQNLDSLEILHLYGVDIEEKTLLDLIEKNPLNELSFTTIHVDPSRLFSVLQKKELRSLCIDLPVENAQYL